MQAHARRLQWEEKRKTNDLQNLADLTAWAAYRNAALVRAKKFPRKIDKLTAGAKVKRSGPVSEADIKTKIAVFNAMVGGFDNREKANGKG